jgi:hypothetical protein
VVEVDPEGLCPLSPVLCILVRCVEALRASKLYPEAVFGRLVDQVANFTRVAALIGAVPSPRVAVDRIATFNARFDIVTVSATRAIGLECQWQKQLFITALRALAYPRRLMP